MNFQKCLPFLISIQLLFSGSAYSQMITGTWKGKIGKQKAEVKIVQKGDSLTGTSYYYESSGNFRRYGIKGYFDKNTNEVIWWDDQLIEERTGKFGLGSLGKIPLLSSADFNCPGGGRMMLDGKAAEKENQSVTKGDLHLDKMETSTFNDEWNFIIDNFTVGTNDPYLIDSVEAIAGTRIIEDPVIREERTIAPVIKTEEPVVQKQVKKQEPIETIKKEEPDSYRVKPAPLVIAKPIEKKFTERTKVFIKEIPVTGDSIELRFYDNAEVDGDSISLFLNNKLVFEHIRLTAVAYIIKLSVKDLNESNELVMVAENLGSIPPNTSYMVAIVKEERYDARLASTEGSSAMIRLIKSN